MTVKLFIRIPLTTECNKVWDPFQEISNAFCNGNYFKFREEAAPPACPLAPTQKIFIGLDIIEIYLILLGSRGRWFMRSEFPRICYRTLKTCKTWFEDPENLNFESDSVVITRQKNFSPKQQIHKNVFCCISVLRTIQHANNQVTVVRRRDLRHRHQRRQVQRHHP